MAIPKRKLGNTLVSSVSLGCMNLSHAYGNAPSQEDGIKLLQKAYDLGINHFDTAILYGFGKNETLVGEAIKPFRDQIYLASKCGLTSPDLTRQVDGRPESIIKACEGSLKRLQTDVIDLYYLHRWDKSIPIEDSIGALKTLVEQGKIKEIGLSEVSAETLRKAHAVHPITALQTEYSLWTRNPEIAGLKACDELGVTFVAFSPLARGYLSEALSNPPNFVEKDLRNNMPRFQPPNFEKNLALLKPVAAIASDLNITVSQLSLAWLLNKDKNLIVIPGTTQIQHLEDNCRAGGISLSNEIIAALDKAINQNTVQGPRYNAKTQLEIDTEEFV